MTKPKKISVNAIEKVMKETHVPSVTAEWNGLEVFIANTIPLNAMMQFVQDVYGGCFMVDTGEYVPEVKDFLIRSSVIEKYTNISLPSNISKRYDILYRTDIYNFVLSYINGDQIDHMFDAIDRRIECAVNANVSGITRQVSNLYSSLEDLEKKTEQLFSGLGEDDIRNITQALGNGNIDEDKLVEAYIKQTSKDDA